MMTKKSFHELVAEKIIEQLKKGTAPWQKPWEPGQQGALIPINPITQKRYKGINALHLMAQEYTDTRWMTYKQANTLDAQVRKGEKGTSIQYWKFTEEIIKKDPQGDPVLDDNGNPIKSEVRLERPKVFYATVFNAEQIDGLSIFVPQKLSWDPIERAEAILKGSGAKISHGENNRAFYRPLTDSVHLPHKSHFRSSARYYATALHELSHWTGHPSRMDRELNHPFGSEAYAKEELRAEISSMILGDELGIGHDPEQHIAYVGSWIKALQNDPLELFRAAADAEKMQQFLLSFELQQEQIKTYSQGLNLEHDYQDVLTTGLDCVFNNADYDFSDFYRDEKESLENALHRNGINSLYDATGGRPEKFHAKAFETLSPIFGLTTDSDRDYPVPYNTLLERDALVEAFVFEAEKRIMEYEQQNKHIDSQKASHEELSSEPRTLEDEIKLLNDIDFNNRATKLQKELSVTEINSTTPKIWLDIPFKQKEVVKELVGTLEDGTKAIQWDKTAKCWFAHPEADLELLKPWLINQTQNTNAPNQTIASEKTWLAVPYVQREAVKQIGGTLSDGTKAVAWDKAAKCWFAHPGANLEQLKPWLLNSTQERQQPALTPELEFAETLRSIGGCVSGDHPIMDGNKHRIEVEGDKKGEKSGFYVGHLDGHPAGYVKNNRTGIEVKWKSKGYVLTAQDKSILQSEATKKLKKRAEEHIKLQEQTALKLANKINDLVPVSSPTPYLKSKGIDAQSGIYTDKDHKITYIPAYDVNGVLWNIQTIQEDGTKRFAKNSKKEECFHVLGGFEALNHAPALLIGEGYATSEVVKQATGLPTICAFDAGNLKRVAQVLRQKYPDKPIFIMGDDDQNCELKHGVNPGKVFAEEAALSVNGTVLFPIFAPGEQEKNPKEFSDFNDLAIKSILGFDGVKRQLLPQLNAVIAASQNMTHESRIKQQMKPHHSVHMS